MNTWWKSSRPLLNQMNSSETLMLQRRDPTSDTQDPLSALLLNLFSWKSGSVRHRQELLSLSSTTVRRSRTLRTSQRNDLKNGLASSQRWEAKMQWVLRGVAARPRPSCVTADQYSRALAVLFPTPAITAGVCRGADCEWRRSVARHPSSSVGWGKPSVGDDSSWHLC